MGYSIAQEDLTDKWWLIGTFGLGYMATIPFKNNRPALDDCTSIENTRTHFRIIRNTWFHIFVLNGICLFFSSLSLSHVSFVSHLPDLLSTCMLLSILLPFNLFTETQPKKNPWQSSKPQATANLCTLPSPPLKRRFVKPVFVESHPFVSRSSVQRQEYDVRHSILVPGSDALRPKLATKAALKCLQRAEGGEEKRKVVGKYRGFLMIYRVYILILETHPEIENHTLFFSFF